MFLSTGNWTLRELEYGPFGSLIDRTQTMLIWPIGFVDLPNFKMVMFQFANCKRLPEATFPEIQRMVQKSITKRMVEICWNPINIWRFPRIGVPPTHHPCSWIFAVSTIYFGRTTIYGNPIISHIFTIPGKSHYNPILYYKHHDNPIILMEIYPRVSTS